MKNNNPKMSEAIAELERCFNELNQSLFHGGLRAPIITVQSSGRKNALGWFCNDIWTCNDTGAHEINISAEYLKRSVLEVIETLIHEMVHLQNKMNGIKDCSANQYHNKKFKVAAEAVGLHVEKTAKKGWAFTSLTDHLTNIINTIAPSAEALDLSRGVLSSASAKGKGSKMKKWVCGCTIVRVATDFQATCDSCGNVFVKEIEGGSDDND
jgi:hypothetical protein